MRVHRDSHGCNLPTARQWNPVALQRGMCFQQPPYPHIPWGAAFCAPLPVSNPPLSQLPPSLETGYVCFVAIAKLNINCVFGLELNFILGCSYATCFLNREQGHSPTESCLGGCKPLRHRARLAAQGVQHGRSAVLIPAHRTAMPPPPR